MRAGWVISESLKDETEKEQAVVPQPAFSVVSACVLIFRKCPFLFAAWM